MYNVCILVVDKNNDVKHFNIIKDDIERTTLIAERELTNFGKIISDDVVGRIRHYKLMTKEDSKITTLDAYIWRGQFVKKYAIRETTFVGGIECRSAVDSVSDDIDEARKALQNRRQYINRELRSNYNNSSITTDGDELNKIVFNYFDHYDEKFKTIEIQIVDTSK